MAFLTKKQLSVIGLKSYGENVFISDKASIYSPELISIGSHVRIDDFCILSGKIILGNHIHISAYSALYGKLGIEMRDYSGLSPRCTIFSASDDFSGDYLISPMVPDKYTNVTGGKVLLNKFTQVGSGTTILPNVTIGEGVAIGAMSLITRALLPWTIYAGIPAKKVNIRSKKLLKFYTEIEEL